jgi:hypothetical protein
MKAKLDFALPVHLAMQGVMVMSIAYSLVAFITAWVAVPVAVCLTWVFAELVERVVAPGPGAGGAAARSFAAGGAVLLFMITMGLSYGTLYARLFAQTSAVKDFEARRVTLQRTLRALHAKGEEARVALYEWAAYAAAKAAEERNNGGTCPAKTHTRGREGPITIWRSEDARVAKSLQDELAQLLTRATRALESASAIKATDFAGVVDVSSKLNQALEHSLDISASGAFPAHTLAAVDSRAAVTVRWNGAELDCEDGVRKHLLDRARMALDGMAKATLPKPIGVSIDLSDATDVVTFGLLRNFNSMLSIVSAGRLGSFDEDPLFREAWARGGLVNRETLGQFLACLVELCVFFTGALSARRRGRVFEYGPIEWLQAWERAPASATPAGRLGKIAALVAAKGLLGMFYTVRSDEAPAHVTPAAPTPVRADPRFHEREIAMGKALAPFLHSWLDRDYLLVPHSPAGLRARVVAQSLQFMRLARCLTPSAGWDDVRPLRPAADALLAIDPQAGDQRYEVYRLSPDYAQCLRLALLAETPL